MEFKFFNSFFQYSRSQQRGLVVLFGICFVLQMVILCFDFKETKNEKTSYEERQWLALQQKMDLLKNQKAKKKFEIKPFNPNFISDFKGYKLGMSVQEIDRLFKFRKQNKYVNSALEFQQVTGVSDSLLKQISCYFKFPNWVNSKKSSIQDKYSNSFSKNDAEVKFIKDINLATVDDLIAIKGIGEVLSVRIVEYKEKLGGFVSMKQLEEVWGLNPTVISELNKHFAITSQPEIKKIAVNDLSLKELSRFLYFKYPLAKQIVIARSMNGDFRNIEELSKIKDFPVDKASIINLYLEF